MEQLDIIDLGIVSPYLATGLVMLNKYRYYEKNTLFCFKSEECIIKSGNKPFSEFYYEDKINNFIKTRMYSQDPPPGVFLLADKHINFLLSLKEQDIETSRLSILSALKETFQSFGIECFYSTNTSLYERGLFLFTTIDGIKKSITSMLRYTGFEYPNSIYLICVPLYRDIDADIKLSGITKIEQLAQYCKELFYTEDISASWGKVSDILTINEQDFKTMYYNKMSAILNCEINYRNITENESELFTHIISVQSDPNWIDNAIHQDFDYI